MDGVASDREAHLLRQFLDIDRAVVVVEDGGGVMVRRNTSRSLECAEPRDLHWLLGAIVGGHDVPQPTVSCLAKLSLYALQIKILSLFLTVRSLNSY